MKRTTTVYADFWNRRYPVLVQGLKPFFVILAAKRLVITGLAVAALSGSAVAAANPSAIEADCQQHLGINQSVDELKAAMTTARNNNNQQDADVLNTSLGLLVVCINIQRQQEEEQRQEQQQRLEEQQRQMAEEMREAAEEIRNREGKPPGFPEPGPAVVGGGIPGDTSD